MCRIKTERAGRLSRPNSYHVLYTARGAYKRLLRSPPLNPCPQCRILSHREPVQGKGQGLSAAHNLLLRCDRTRSARARVLKVSTFAVNLNDKTTSARIVVCPEAEDDTFGEIGGCFEEDVPKALLRGALGNTFRGLKEPERGLGFARVVAVPFEVLESWKICDCSENTAAPLTAFFPGETQVDSLFQIPYARQECCDLAESVCIMML